MNGDGDVTITAEFLDEAAIARILTRRSAATASSGEDSGEARLPVLQWAIGEEHYATPLGDIREVGELPPVTRVPGAPPALRGVVAWRGEVVNLIDPAALLGATAAAESDSKMIVLRTTRAQVALQVSTVIGLVSAPAAVTPGVDSLTYFVGAADGELGFALVATERLVDRFLARASQNEW